MMARQSSKKSGPKGKTAPSVPAPVLDDPMVGAYLASVRKWHGYIKFLGMPHLSESPDLRIDRLFVEPAMAERHIPAELDQESWPETTSAMAAIVQNPRLVMLGDPGCGKSTLVSWLAWQMARPEDGLWTEALGRLLPVPMVLREMKIGPDITWQRLLDAFFNTLMAEPLKGFGGLEALIQQGRVLFMLDGLDEIGSVAVREALRGAVFEGFRAAPECHWLLTSRIVGYEQVSFDRPDAPPDGEDEDKILTRSGQPLATVQYAAPFDDSRIKSFAANWYAQREAAKAKAAEEAKAFNKAVHHNPAILSLARVPNLLTFMARIFRTYAQLPDGRALLYERIAQAYLESIDQFRKITEGEYSLAQKKRWLGRVAFEMQMRREVKQNERGEIQENPEGILATQNKVTGWIIAAMTETGRGADAKEAAQFVDHIARRSGLLLPRGHDAFAFMHLSFQEYFAAYFLLEQVTAPRWLLRGKAAEGATPDDLRRHADNPLWQEALVFLAELLADRPDWPETLIETLFGDGFDVLYRPDTTITRAAAPLLARLATDPHSGLSDALREQAVQACVTWQVNDQQRDAGKFSSFRSTPSVFRTLFAAGGLLRPQVWSCLVEVLGNGAQYLSLNGCAIDALPGDPPLPSSLSQLDLGGTDVSDLAPLAGLTGLQWLGLDGTGVSDLAPLAGLTGLETLFLNGTDVSDLAPLAGLTGLETLDLGGTGVSDLAPLAGLTGLQRLDLGGTGVSDLAPLAGLTGLQWLLLMGTGVSDLAPLAGLTGLERLDLDGTDVSDLAPLAGLTGLQWLDLDGTGVSDLALLAGLTGLETLFLRGTGVSEDQVAAFRKAHPGINIYR